jgi:hypothetical protein
MRTETDVREALDTRPDPEALRRLSVLIAELSEPEAERRRGRGLAPVLAAAAVAAAVAASAFAASGLIARWGESHEAGGGPTPRPEPIPAVWHFSVDPVPGYTITRVGITRELGIEEGATVAAAASPVTGFLNLLTSQMRGYDDNQGTAVSVNGHPGYFVAGTHVSQDNLITSVYHDPWRAALANHDHQPQLYWRYPDGSWARLSGTFGFDPATYDYDNSAAEAIMLRIARAMHRDVQDPVRMPFRVTTVPAGLVLESVELYHGVPCLGYGSPTRLPGGGQALVCRVVTGATRAETLQHARPGGVTSTAVVRDLSDGTSVVVTYPAGGSDQFTLDEANQVANSLDVSPALSDPSTWLVVP